MKQDFCNNFSNILHPHLLIFNLQSSMTKDFMVYLKKLGVIHIYINNIYQKYVCVCVCVCVCIYIAKHNHNAQNMCF